MGDNRKSRVVPIGYGLSNKGAFIPFGKQLSGKFSYISKFHILISYKLTIYIVMCFYQGTN